MKKDRLILLLILIFGLLFRVFGLSWDQGYNLHPDERMIVMVTEKIFLPSLSNWQTFFTSQSSFNPNFFAYGSLPIYLLKFTSTIASLFGGEKWTTYQYLPIVGRMISVLFDLGVVVLIFKIGKKIFSKKVALLAAFLYASCVFPLQSAHFYTVDVPLNFFVWLTLWFLIGFYENPKVKTALKVGASFGLALATKVSATVLLAAIGTALIADFLLLGIKLWGERKAGIIPKLLLLLGKVKRKQAILQISKRLFVYGGLIFLVAVLVFIIIEPYAVIDFPNFWRQIKNQQEMTKDAYIFPYTLQYVGTASYFYPLKNMVVYGLGLGLGTVSLFAIFFYLASLVKRIKKPGNYDSEAKEIILSVFFLTYFLIVGGFAIKFMRYCLPLYPFFVLISAWFFREIKSKVGKSYSLFFILFIFVHLFWTFSFISIYSRPHSRVAATNWINKNIPSGSVIAVEHWDDRLPLVGSEKYLFLEMPMYEPDQSISKWEKVESNLKRADYIILSSNRLYVPLMKLVDCSKHKKCYPETVKYYQDLFSGELGFEKVADFSLYPGIKIGDWEFEINDQSADESFTVYDHPRVIIFKGQEK